MGFKNLIQGKSISVHVSEARLSQGLEPATTLLHCPVGSQRSTLGHNGNSGKCVLVRHSLSRPCFTTEGEREGVCACVWKVCVYWRVAVWISVCVLWGSSSKQAPNGTKPRGIELLLTTTVHVCHPHLPPPSLSSFASSSPQMVLALVLFFACICF